jgi:hypothetical protein
MHFPCYLFDLHNRWAIELNSTAVGIFSYAYYVYVAHGTFSKVNVYVQPVVTSKFQNFAVIVFVDL